jgi:hypothetical protein
LLNIIELGFSATYVLYEKFTDNRESIPEDFQLIRFTEILKHTLNEVGGNYIKSVRNFCAARV